MIWNELAIKLLWRFDGLRIMHPDVDDAAWRIVRRVYPYTLTPTTRILSLIDVTRYVQRAGVPGAFVECGVWRGGSIMAMSMAAAEQGPQRDLWLYDTFAGMPPPSAPDTSSVAWLPAKQRQAVGGWCAVHESEVLGNLYYADVDLSRIRSRAGMVEYTLRNGDLPEQIAILRLDTDWYESTRLELEVLWPRVAQGGVLIVDDYGHWDGCRRAVDEYFGPAVLMHRVDYAARVIVKA